MDVAECLAKIAELRIYVDRRGKVSGPHSAEDVWQLLERRELHELDEIWCEGAPEPIPAWKLMAAGPRSAAAIELLAGPLLPPEPARPNRPAMGGLGLAMLVQMIGPVGCLGTSGLGTGLLGLGCILLFFLGNEANNRNAMERQHVDQLRKTIVRFVADNPQHGAPSLDELQRLGAITAEDKQFLLDQGMVYQPISAQSPDNALIFVQPNSMGEDRIYKNGQVEAMRRYNSNNGKWTLICDPADPTKHQYTVQIVHNASQRIVHREEIEALNVHAEWTRDGRFVLVSTTSRNSDNRFKVLDMASGAPKPVAMPKGLDPVENLGEAERGEVVHWKRKYVRGYHWLNNHTLLVEMDATAELGEGPAESRDDLFMAVHFQVQIQENGEARIVERKVQNYRRLQPRLAAAPARAVAPARQAAEPAAP